MAAVYLIHTSQTLHCGYDSLQMAYWLDLHAFQEQPCHFPLTVWVSAVIQTCADRRVSVTYGGGSAVEVGAACCVLHSAEMLY